MTARRIRIAARDKLVKAIEDIGGEPLAGSGFEDETPDLEFTQESRAKVIGHKRADLPAAL